MHIYVHMAITEVIDIKPFANLNFFGCDLVLVPFRKDVLVMKDPVTDLEDRVLAKYGIGYADRQIALKGDWRFLMRPGFDLRVRVYACLQLHARGYPVGGGEFCITQVAGKKKKKGEGPSEPEFVPLTPALIADELLDMTIECFRAAGKELSDKEREEWRINTGSLRRVMEILEIEDGAITRVTVRKLSARDKATSKDGAAELRQLWGTHEKRKLPDGNEKWVQATAGPFFDQALKQKLVVPIHGLSEQDGKKLANRSFVYLHLKPRPATLVSLTRKADEYTAALSVKTKGNHKAQLVLNFARQLGIDDPKIASKLTTRPELKADLEEITRGEEIVAAAKASLRAHMTPLVQAFQKTGSLPRVPVQTKLFEPEDAPSEPVDHFVDINKMVPPTGQTQQSGDVPEKPDAGRQPLVASQPAAERMPDARGQGPAKTPLVVAQPDTGNSGINKPPPSAAVFHETLVARFQDADADPPVYKQSHAAYRKLGAHAGVFLDWLTVAELERRGVEHAGILMSLVEEFLRKLAKGPPRAKPPKEEDYAERMAKKMRSAHG